MTGFEPTPILQKLTKKKKKKGGGSLEAGYKLLPAKGVIKTKQEPIMALGLIFSFFAQTIKICHV